MLGYLVAANALLAATYALYRGSRRDEPGLAVFFFFLPGIGFLFYFVPCGILNFLARKEIDKAAYVTMALEIERPPEHPDVREQLNVVPVEDALAISGKTEKRILLLNQLKKDLKENYKILLAATEDEDTETAHYAASAKMEVSRFLQQQWLECRREYESSPGDAQNYHAACETLANLLGSGVFSAREQNSYRKRFCDLVQGQIDAGEGEVSTKEYEVYLRSLAELGRYEDAQRLWQEKADRMKSESSYQTMLKIFYQAGEREQFEACLEDLGKNRQIRLSPEGLEQLRYWRRRLFGATGKS